MTGPAVLAHATRTPVRSMTDPSARKRAAHTAFSPPARWSVQTARYPSPFVAMLGPLAPFGTTEYSGSLIGSSGRSARGAPRRGSVRERAAKRVFIDGAGPR